MWPASLGAGMHAFESTDTGNPRDFSQEARRDVWAFAAVAAFAVQIYAIPGEWIEVLAPLRLALVLSSLALGLFALRRLGRMEPISLDGIRGFGLLAFTALSVASIGWSVNPEVSKEWVVELLKLVAIYITFVNVVSTPTRVVVVAGAMVVASIVPSVGVMEWYHDAKGLVDGFRGRWLGVYADPNHLAANLAVVLPLATAFVVRKKTPALMKLLCVVAFGLAVVGIVETHSRGGFIGLVVSLTVWAILEKPYRMKALAVGAVLAMCLGLFAPKSFWERNDTLENFKQDESALGRVYAWHVASGISLDKPLLGVGAGGFRYAWPSYAPPEAHRAYVAHNIYLDAIGELGWVGLLFFLIFSGAASGGAFAATNDPDIGWLARGLAASIVGYLLCNCFSGYALSAHLYVLFGLAACVERIALTSAVRVPSAVPRDEIGVNAYSQAY